MIRLYEALQLPLSAMNSEAAPASFEVSAIECAIRRSSYRMFRIN